MKQYLVVLGTCLVVACSSGSDPSSQPSPAVPVVEMRDMSGVVSHYFTGEPIANAQIRTYGLENDRFELLATESSSADGHFTTAVPRTLTSLLIDVSQPGFGRQIRQVSLDANLAINLTPLLLPANASLDGSAQDPLTLNYNDGESTMTVLSINGSSLADRQGNLYSGPITLYATVVDPSSDPGVMPGGFQAIDPSNGNVNLLESFGALDLQAFSAAGESLDLLPGASASIRIPLASSVNPSFIPETIPLFFFDTSRGLWIADGEANLVDVDGTWAYVGDIDRLGLWNADILTDTTTLSGCLVNAEGQGIANARVLADGRDYIGRSEGFTNINGEFALQTRSNSTVLVSAIYATQSETIIVDTTDSDQALDTCLELSENAATARLTWGTHPVDLDSHLFGPGETSPFHIYWLAPQAVVSGVLFDLDVDDVQSFGPEVVTIPSFPLPGIYEYWVNLFGGAGDIKHSPTRVELNLQGELHVFNASLTAGEPTDNWHVFNLEVDASGQVTLQVVDEFKDSMANLVYAFNDSARKKSYRQIHR